MYKYIVHCKWTHYIHVHVHMYNTCTCTCNLLSLQRCIDHALHTNRTHLRVYPDQD